MKMAQCMPRLMVMKSDTTTASPVSSSSLLQRIREVVLKLIMLSAMLKSTATTTMQSPERMTAAVAANRQLSSTYLGEESYRSEAVEDCIEFVKRSAGIVKTSSAGLTASSTN